jgi:hypothetical protein
MKIFSIDSLKAARRTASGEEHVPYILNGELKTIIKKLKRASPATQ